MSSRISTVRSIDSDRRSQVEVSISSGTQQASKQQEQIRLMQEENDQLKSDINALSGKHYDYAKADKLATLQGEVDALERRFQFEKMKKNDLTKRYQLARIDLLQSRKMRGGINADKEQADAVQRQVDILENRLDQALGKFNDALLYNKELREQIDVIREERRVFQRVHRKMEGNLRATQNQMAAQIEQTNKDMDERDEYLRQIEELNRNIAQQHDEHNEQLREMDVAMLEIKAMREDQTNLQLELEAREYDFNSRLEDVKREQANPDLAEANTTQQRAAGLSRTRGVDSASEEGFTDTMATNMGGTSAQARDTTNINETYNQIREATQEDDLDAMRTEYLRLGDSNFSLYKYINELTAAREELRDEVRDLKSLISEETESSTQQRKLIKELEEKLALTEYQLEGLQTVVGNQRDAMKRITSTTEDVHTHIGCNRGADAVCNETNLMAFLGQIEERSTVILYAAQRKERERAQAAALAAVYTPKETPVTRALGDDEEEDEENALTEVTLPEPLSADVLHPSPSQMAEEVMAPLPTAPQTTHNAVSAQRLVRAVELPSANILTTNSGDADLFDDDHIVSHEEIRRQMEQRLLAKRDREERTTRKKK